MSQEPDALDFRLIFESFPGLCVVVDPSFRVVAVTDMLLENTHASREDLLGKVLYEAFPDNDPWAEGARNLRASLERVRDSLEPDTMPVQRYDVRRRHPDGDFDERYWTPTNSPVVKDGLLAYIVQRLQDITAYVKMTEAAEASGDEATQLQTQAETMEAELVSRRSEIAQASRRLKESHAQMERLYRQAREASLHDPLTGLANRVLLLDHLELGLAESGRTQDRVGVMFLDLDGFKEVNDQWGHPTGDAVLQETARRLQMVVRPGDTVARVGGDEFVVVCPTLDGPDDLEALAHRVEEAVGATTEVGQLRLTVPASVGTALASDSIQSAEALLAVADAEMYEIRRQRRAALNGSR